MAVKNRVLVDGPRHLVVQCTLDTGAVGESTVLKVDRDATTHSTAAAGSVSINPLQTLDAFVIEKITWSVEGFTTVEVIWRFNAGNELAASLGAGEGLLEYYDVGGMKPDTSRDTAQAADGDIVFTTEAGASPAATDNYTVMLHLRKKYVP